jgi:hypothetical protein
LLGLDLGASEIADPAPIGAEMFDQSRYARRVPAPIHLSAWPSRTLWYTARPAKTIPSSASPMSSPTRSRLSDFVPEGFRQERRVGIAPDVAHERPVKGVRAICDRRHRKICNTRRQRRISARSRGNVRWRDPTHRRGPSEFRATQCVFGHFPASPPGTNTVFAVIYAKRSPSGALA